jgi:hypothetical protein
LLLIWGNPWRLVLFGSGFGQAGGYRGCSVDSAF